MPPTEPENNELYRFGEIAYDVAQIYGVTTEQGLKRARRALNRAMISIVGSDRKWSWLRVKDSFHTTSGVREYSLQREVRGDISHVWMEGTTPGKLSRVPTGQMLRSEPNPEAVSGTPTLFDYEGVDSSGCIVMTLYPTPSGDFEIFHRYTKRIAPLDDVDQDVRTYWGLPDELLEALTQKAAALCVQGVSTEKYMALNSAAEGMIEMAYSSDQSRTNTRYIAPMQENGDRAYGDPRLPPQFDREY